MLGSAGPVAIRFELRRQGDGIYGRARIGRAAGEVVVAGTIDAAGAFRLEEGLFEEAEPAAVWTGRLRADTLAGRPAWRMVGERAEPGGLTFPLELWEEWAPLGGGRRVVPEDAFDGDSARGWHFYAELPRIEPESLGTRGFDALVAAGAAAGREAMQVDDPELRGPYPWTFESWYRVVLADRDLLSVEIEDSSYTGGAHPNTTTRTITWNLRERREVALEDLFRPGTDWLAAVAGFAQKALELRSALVPGLSGMTDAEWLAGGAGPDPVNYRAWTLSAEGLRIVFDAYQVAAYAAGPQEVTVPWGALAGLLDLDGPAARLIGAAP